MIFNNFVTSNNSFNWLGIIGAITGILALVISILVAWFSNLRASKVVGILSGLEFCRYSNLPNGEVTDRKIIPLLILQNIGARSAAVEFIRLKFNFGKKDIYYSYPTSFNTEKSTEHFVGFVLSKNEIWKNNYPFSMRIEHYEKLVDKKGKVEVEIKLLHNKSWKKITINNFEFFSVRKFLLPMILKGPGKESCYLWSNTRNQL